MLSFEKFLVIINYLTNRLQNHSIYVSSKHQGGMIKEAPQFLAFINDIECQEDEVVYVLNILSCGDNANLKEAGIYFVKIGKELTIQTKTQRNCYLLQTINDNLKLFNENKDKKIELSKILNNQNEMYKLLIKDIDKPAILNELLKENRQFGMIQNISNAIYNAKSPVNIKFKNKINNYIDKPTLRKRCVELIEELIPIYLKNEHLKDGGFKKELFEEIEKTINNEYPNSSFNFNILNESWKSIVNDNPNYKHLSNHGRRYKKEKSQ